MSTAHEPIMMGNAAIGFIPSRLIKNQTGRVQADAERHQRAEHEVDRDARRRASGPRVAEPRRRWAADRGSSARTEPQPPPAPRPCRAESPDVATSRQFPRRATRRLQTAAIIETSVAGPTLTTPMKISPCATVGSVWPTFSVPGIVSSGTTRRNLNAAVVGANEPMPRVSKKFVTKPIARRSRPGFAADAAGRSSPLGP